MPVLPTTSNSIFNIYFRLNIQYEHTFSFTSQICLALFGRTRQIYLLDDSGAEISDVDRLRHVASDRVISVVSKATTTVKDQEEEDPADPDSVMPPDRFLKVRSLH